jgi:hypothetical protein
LNIKGAFVLLAAGVAFGVFALYAFRGWSRWRDLVVVWGIVLICALSVGLVADALPFALGPAASVSIFTATLVREFPYKGDNARAASVPPWFGAGLIHAQVVVAAVASLLWTRLLHAPSAAAVLTMTAYMLVGLEVVARLRSGRSAPAD